MESKDWNNSHLLEKRFKIIIILLLVIFISNIAALIILEGRSILDSLYFLVITISTVGYGDITPNHPVSKVLLILLILSTLTILATVSEFVINRIVERRQKLLRLPENGFGLSNHIIIGGINEETRLLAAVLESRFMTPILIAEDEDKIRDVREEGLTAFVGDLKNPEDLDKLELDKADVVFLFLDNIEDLIKTTIIIRTYEENILIFASTGDAVLDQEFAQQVGISRVYSFPRLVGSFISVITRSVSSFVFADQPERDAYYYYFVTLGKYSDTVDDIIGPNFITGIGNYSQLKFYNNQTQEFEEYFSKDLKNNRITNQFQISYIFPKENYDSSKSYGDRLDVDQIELEARYHHFIIFGYSSMVEYMIPHLRISPERFIIVTFDPDQFKRSETSELESVYIADKEGMHAFIDEHIHEGDVVFNFLEDLEEALRVTITISQKDQRVDVFQYIIDRYEADIFRKFNVQGFIHPKLLIVQAMFQYYLKICNYSLSTLNQQSHRFEYVIHQHDPLIGKPLKYLMDRNYTVLLHRRWETRAYLDLPPFESDQVIIRQKDVLLLEKHFRS